MQKHLITKQRGKPIHIGFRGVLAAMLLSSLLFATGAFAAPMHGTYTIDASGFGNYTTFGQAVADLDSNGVSGKVEFDVTAATYAEVVTVGTIPGASSTNTITFHGMGRTKTTLSSTGVVVSVSAYTFFDGMSIVTTGGGLIKANSSNDCGFSNCNLIGAVTGSANLISANNSKYLTLYNNEISGGGQYGLSLDGSSTGSAAFGYLRCTHNRFVNMNEECIDINYDFKDSIAFNTFDSAAGTMYEAMYCEEPNGLIFWGNKLYTDSYDGIDIYSPDEYQVSGSPTQSYFVNNWIVITDNSSNNYEGADIDLYQSPNFTLAFNTFYNYGAEDEALDLDCDDASGTVFANNLFYGTVAGYDGQLDLDVYSSSFALYDGNDIYSTASGVLVYYYNSSTGGGNYNSYAAYASAVNGNGWDLHGTNIAAPFVSLTYPYDLHMSTTLAAPKGVGGTGISTDMDGKGRFPTPTPGACESYYGVVKNNSGVTALISPVAQCPGTATVSVQVTNLGLNAINSGSGGGVTIAWNWNGTPEASVVSTKGIPLYSTDTIVLGTVTLTAGTAYTFKAWPTKTNGLANAGGKIDTLSLGGIMAALSGGTYTIDGSKAASASNFKSFATAVTALNAGICGPVVFNVSAASYTESISIGSVLGGSSTNTVVFNGAGRTKTTLTNKGNTLTMKGSGYVIFDNMTISTTGKSNNVITDANTTNCGFISDNLIAPNGGGGNVIGSTSSTGLKVRNCRIVGNNYSLNIGSNFDSFTNNRIIGLGYEAINDQSCHGNVYQYNTVDSVYATSPYAIVYDETGSGETWNANYFYGRNSAGAIVHFSEYGLNFGDPNQSATTVGTSTVPLTFSFTNNIYLGTASENGFYFDGYNNNAPIVVAFNTIKVAQPSGVTPPYYPIELEWEDNNSPTVFASNIFMSQDAIEDGMEVYINSTDFLSGIPSWDKGGIMYDGNDWIITAPSAYTFGYFNNSNITSIAAYYSSAQKNNWELNGASVPPNFLNTGANPLFLDTTKAGPAGVGLCTPVATSNFVFAGVPYDIAGRKRCALFPTAGAYEDPFGKAPKATKIFVPTSGIYPNSPATIYQSYVKGDPAVYTWYIKNSNYSTWTPIDDTSADLYYSAWTLGTDSLKLVTQSCQGYDSTSVGFKVAAPNSTPATDFIASANTVQQNTSVQFTDLSTDGPTKWSWTISPDSITVGTLKYPSTTLISSSLDHTQNPDVQFLYPGYYSVCLTAYNGIGKGTQNCKSNYINVVPAVNMNDTLQTLTTSTGYIFDNGGPEANYTGVASPYIQSVLIAPCADSIYLTFSQFDTKCGTDFVKLYNGSSPDPTKQVNTVCNNYGTGTNNLGPGFNGGPTNNSCSFYCVPNVSRPDTFKAGKTMLLTMDCFSGGAPGFAAYYWVKPSNAAKVAPSFTTASGDTVCAGQIVDYQNTTKIDPTDVASFEWDLDGDFTDGFECVGTCATALWPYFLPGTVPVTLIAINCGGADTLVKDIVVKSPPKPVAAFTASIVAPTTTDVDVFTSTTTQCVDNYKWTITPVAGTGGGAAVNYVNGTSNASASPQVNFPDTGYYDVSLYVDNASATQTNTLVKKKYIHVRDPYCIPAVASLSEGIGINHVVFNTIDNYTTPQAKTGYLDFTKNASLSTDIAIGATYTVSVSRELSSISSGAINRDVYIDWNEDGYFTGPGEDVAQDSDSKSETFSKSITVPKTAKLGATVMRIATNLYLYPNVPCGPNQFGEFEDYRVVVTPYNIPPVITLKGESGLADTIKVEQGYAYTDSGYTATSYLYGNITKNVMVTSKIVGGSGAFSNMIPGVYIFSYDVMDSAGNKAVTQHRVVWVTKDKTPPVLKVATYKGMGGDTIYQEVTTKNSNLVPPLSSYIISSIDLVDGNLYNPVTGAGVFVDSSLVNTAVVGVYPVTYSSSDYSSPPNTDTVIRYVYVIDTIKPVLTLLGANPYKVEVNTPFVDPGVLITSPNGILDQKQLAPDLVVTNSVDISVLGTYTVTYNLTDTFKNVAKTVIRTVDVVDTIPPVIQLYGNLNDSIAVDNTFIDPGYVISDNFTKTSDLTFTVGGTFYSTFGTPKGYADKLGGGSYAGTNGIAPVYTIVYTATDGSGNKTSVTRNVEVYDNTAPVISLVGPVDVTQCRWYAYKDLGYTVSDNYEDSASFRTETAGGCGIFEYDDITATGGTNVAGHFMSLWYTAVDQSHNVGTSAYRRIQVIEAPQSPCTSGIEPNLALDKYITIFPNPSSGIFTVNANLPAVQNVRITVVNMLGQQVAVVHNGNLLNNSFKVDLSAQSSGVYFLNIVTDNQTLTKRIEITK